MLRIRRPRWEWVAAQIESQRADAVLVVGADLLSHHTDPDDRSTAGLFGDGAGRRGDAGRSIRRAGSGRSCSGPTAPTPSWSEAGARPRA